MGIVSYVISCLIPLGVAVYTFNFGRWLWRGGNRQGAVGAMVLMALSGGGAITYFTVKLLM